MDSQTCPEDWWISISQIVNRAIDKEANNESVRTFFVSHEGKKTLSVHCTLEQLTSDDNGWFFKEMKDKISQNINNSEYTDIMDCEFSGSSTVQKIVSDIMLMYGFKEYFEYVCLITTCGIPGVIMEGSENDWKLLLEKHERLEMFLKPIDDVLKLSGWFKSSKTVLEKLIDTYQGKPDTNWWSRIIYKNYDYGSCGSEDEDRRIFR